MIPDRAGDPVFKLEYDSDDDVKNETCHQENLENLDNVIRPHKVGRIGEPLAAVVPEEAQVNTQMNNQKDHQEEP